MENILMDIADAVTASNGVNLAPQLELILKGKPIDQLSAAMVEVCRGSSPDLVRVRPDILRILINMGADIHYVNEENLTPLLVCVRGRDFRTVEFLLQNGAHLRPDPRVLARAVRSGNRGMVALLLQYLSLESNPGVAFIALRERDTGMMRLLMAAGQDPAETLGNTEGAATLLESSFLRGVYLEKGLLQCLTDVTWAWQIPGIVTDFISHYEKELEFIKIFYEMGCPALRPDALLFAIDKNAFLTLADTYSVAVQMHKMTVWPSDVRQASPDIIRDQVLTATRPHVLTAVRILRDMVTRTRKFCRNSGVMVRYLDDILMKEVEGVAVPALADCAVDEINHSILQAGGNFETAAASLHLPRKIAKQLNFFRDLDERSLMARRDLYDTVLHLSL